MVIPEAIVNGVIAPNNPAIPPLISSFFLGMFLLALIFFLFAMTQYHSSIQTRVNTEHILRSLLNLLFLPANPPKLGHYPSLGT